MDINKKFLYFNTDSANQDGAITVPVSTLVAFDVRASNSICLMIKEAVQTDTTDVFLNRPVGADPRDIIEKIVNEINFSKDAMIVVGDDNTSEYIHPDIDAINSITAATYSSPLIKLGSDIHAFRQQATEPGDGFSTSNYNFNTGSVGTINGEVITTLFIDLNGLTCPGTINQAIGTDSSSDPAYFTRITTGVNGIVYRGEIICVQATGGSGTIGQINIVANSVGTIDPGEDTTSGTSDVIMNMTDEFTIAEVRNFDSSTINVAGTNNPQGGIGAGGIQNYYLYLAPNTSGQTGGTFTSGKFIIRLYGAPTVNLNEKT